MESKRWVIGDSVMVKPGITERVTGGTISGWQGRLLAFEEKGERLTIQWDSLTLKRLPFAYIAGCEDWSVSWSTMRLAPQDLLPVAARDREEEVVAALASLERNVSWLSWGEQGLRIRQIVNRGKAHDLFTSYETWRAYLQEHLAFPFVATVVEAQRGPVPQGTQITVTGTSLVDDTMGIIVRSRLKRRVYHLPLCELRSTMVPAEIQQLIEDYAKWFNRHASLYARSLKEVSDNASQQ